MSSEISFCPVCAGKLETGVQDQYACEECEMQFLIEVVDVDDTDDAEDDEDDEEEEEKDADDDY